MKPSTDRPVQIEVTPKTANKGEAMSENKLAKQEANLYPEVREVLLGARQVAYRAINVAMVQAYWRIGQLIIENEQKGEKRAEYGKAVLQELSAKLIPEFGCGFSVRNLQNMRLFFLYFPIWQTLSANLTWSHYSLLITVEKATAREFYAEECVKANWSVRQLRRQISSFFYERLLVSQNKPAISAEIQTLEPGIQPTDIIRDPYVLEFTGLKADPGFYESSLEDALIANLQQFLLELGRGFSFVARQQRISLDGEHFFIDLVFYNYILKCFVLFDLKTGHFTHQDAGQMAMYVNYYTREFKNEGDNPPIGIVLCTSKSDAVVKYTLPEDNKQIYISKYMLYLPSEAELKAELDKGYRLLEEGAKGNPPQTK